MAIHRDRRATTMSRCEHPPDVRSHAGGMAAGSWPPLRLAAAPQAQFTLSGCCKQTAEGGSAIAGNESGP
jgi:hypothetical protein